MTLSKGQAPTTGETITRIFTAPDLRRRVLTTIGLLLFVRVGAYIWIPGLDVPQLQQELGGGQLIGLLSIFTGGAPGGVFSLGILPFINASIIIQLLTAALPSLETLQKTRVRQDAANWPKSPATWPWDGVVCRPSSSLST